MQTGHDQGSCISKYKRKTQSMTASFRRELKKGVVGPFDMEAQVGSISAPFENGTPITGAIATDGITNNKQMVEGSMEGARVELNTSTFSS
ncbi:hypothetical protein PNOK_0971700 [Pyrrhoderma noxium]|uniref:Uncharacterized protein n=1 Tax=Pyrrhoderma noxium TaxID=2282107 RepID=A0A286U549_9AGAM|nr:hypothetical protein PNOK_0971700 [Pyrrhoderma noxium]